MTGTTPEKTGADNSETPGTSAGDKTEPGPSTSGEGNLNITKTCPCNIHRFF